MGIFNWIHPAFILILGSVLIPVFQGRVRQAYILLLPALAFITVATMSYGTYGVVPLLGQELVFGRVDKLSYVFAFIFTLMAFISGVYSLHVKESGQHIAAYVYAGGAVGLAFAGDYLTLFVFAEFMAFASMCLILFRRTPESTKAAYRYILVHIFSGICMLGGALLQYSHSGSFAFDPVTAGGLASALLLIGFITNAAVPPFGSWLPDAYPMATVTGAVFMSSFTTKSAIYTLARGFAGTEILIILGTVMAIYGVVYAVLENDIRRLLAYHIISQVGYMVAAVGIGTELAINGAAAHAFAHILYKGLLFMGAGSVLYMTGRSKLTELGGIYKHMPWTFILYMIGGFAISSVPLFSGFVSKSIILSAAGESHMAVIWLLLTLASAGTFLHTGLKLPYFTFLGKDSGVQAKDPPLNMLIGMGLAAFMCVFVGIYPQFLYSLLPYAVEYHPYTAEHVVWTSQILLFTALGFWLYIKKLGGEQTMSLDTDWFYRKGSVMFMKLTYGLFAAVDDIVSNLYKPILSGVKRAANWCWGFDFKWIDGMVNGVAGLVVYVSGDLRRLQTGKLQHYAVTILLGLLFFINLLLFFS